MVKGEGERGNVRMVEKYVILWKEKENSEHQFFKSTMPTLVMKVEHISEYKNKHGTA